MGRTFNSQNFKTAFAFCIGNVTAFIIISALHFSRNHKNENALNNLQTSPLLAGILKGNTSGMKPIRLRERSNRTIQDYKSLGEWANSIEAIMSDDQNRIDNLVNVPNMETTDEIRQQFYSIINQPLQSVCTVGKFFGGQWINECGAMDGQKFICLDKLFSDVLNGKCLIYSFGIAEDWSFEAAMAELGCTVRAFDPTIDGSEKPETEKISFKKIGMKEFSGTVDGLGSVLTLKDAVQLFGDSGKVISYLKVDIEGSELQSIPEWISSGIIDQVSQFGIEIHTSAIGEENAVEGLSSLLDTMRKLYDVGFRLVSTLNNECVGKTADFEDKYYDLMEVVFYKEK